MLVEEVCIFFAGQEPMHTTVFFLLDESLRLPLPLPPDVRHINTDQSKSFPPPPKRSLMLRPGVGADERHIELLSNHFGVKFTAEDFVFFHYNVTIKSGDEPAEGKGLRMKVEEKLYQTYSSELAGKNFAYDGKKSLFTVGSLRILLSLLLFWKSHLLATQFS